MVFCVFFCSLYVLLKAEVYDLVESRLCADADDSTLIAVASLPTGLGRLDTLTNIDVLRSNE